MNEAFKSPKTDMFGGWPPVTQPVNLNRLMFLSTLLDELFHSYKTQIFGGLSMDWVIGLV